MKRHIQRLAVACVLICLISPSSLFAQKKKLELDDYAQFERLGETLLSPNGAWLAYAIIPVEGDGWLAVKEVGSEDEHKLKYGSRATFSNDNRWFAFSIGVSEDEEKKLEKSKKPVRLKLGLMELASAVVDTFEYVESFSFSDDGQYLAMRKYKAEGVKTNGADLVVRNLDSGKNQNIGNVSEFGFSEEGALLAVVIDASDKLGNGVQLLNLPQQSIQILDSDEKVYKGLKWAEESASLAVLKAQEIEDHTEPNHVVLTFTNLEGNRVDRVYDSSRDPSFPADHRIASEGSLRWSDDTQILFVGLKSLSEEKAQIEADEEDKKDDAIAENQKEDDESEGDSGEDEEENEPEKKKTIADRDKDLDPPGVDIWHWNDTRVQPQQQVQASRDRNFTYMAALSVETGSLVQLADSERKNVTLTGDQRHAVLFDSTPYEPAFREGWRDVYVKNVQSGSESKVLERIESVSVSPEGEYLLYFRTDDWWSYDIDSKVHTNLTAEIPTRFNNFKAIYGRENDRQWGNGQWSKDDGWVLAYDEYDVYRLNPDGSSYKRLTFGAEDRVRFRQVRLDFEEDTLDPEGPIYFSAYGDFTKNSGYYRLDASPTTEDGASLSALMYEPRSISQLRRAKEANVFTYVTQKADESPNVFAVDERFDKPVQLTTTNPFQDEFLWGHTELITYTNTNGVELQGRLLYPADYEPGNQYPMMVYIYELRSQSLHQYTLPSRTNGYNQRRYSSEGYFVFEPDIVYRLRDPGMSAVECIVPAVEKVLETGMVKADQIGLTGHSWGAYQTSFVVSQTDLFAAAVAGAPLTNMISMYNSVYWNSGSTDAQIFEVSQGRFPDPYWEDWDKFVQNSPIFNAEQINTPLMIAFGDEDGAVDFNQGVEMYNTMRRLEKPFVMLVYEGENHGNRKKENQIDYANRSHDWFNHFLRGMEPAEWIAKGIPFLEKDLEKKKQAEAKEKETDG